MVDIDDAFVDDLSESYDDVCAENAELRDWMKEAYSYIVNRQPHYYDEWARKLWRKLYDGYKRLIDE